MDLIFKWLLLLAFASSTNGRSGPQVQESPEDTKIVRNTTKFQRSLFAPFNLHAIQQQDLQALRYLEQQKVDARNWMQKQRVAQNRRGRIRRSFLKPAKRDVDINPLGLEGHVQQKPDEKQLLALTALIGKNPNQQLQGLNAILRQSQASLYPTQHTQEHVQAIPIEEDVVDVANAQAPPNVNVPNGLPFYPEFNALAYQRAQQILAQSEHAAQQQQFAAEQQFAAQQQFGATQQLSFVDNGPKANMIFVTPMPKEEEVAPTVELQQAVPLIEFHTQPLVELRQPAILELKQPKQLKLEEPQREERDGNVSKYAFGYRVRDYHSGNDFGHEEVNEGDYVKGQYHVLLPDGRLQKVRYWADKSGFHSKVTYENIAKH